MKWLRNFLFMRRHMKACRAAQTLGKLGGKARAEQLREPIRAKAREMLSELGRPDDPRLA